MKLQRCLLVWCCLLIVGWIGSLAGASGSGPRAADFHLDEARLDEVMHKALDHGDLPGAVVLIVHGDRVVFRKAYGLRSRRPTSIPCAAASPS